MRYSINNKRGLCLIACEVGDVFAPQVQRGSAPEAVVIISLTAGGHACMRRGYRPSGMLNINLNKVMKEMCQIPCIVGKSV